MLCEQDIIRGLLSFVKTKPQYKQVVYISIFKYKINIIFYLNPNLIFNNNYPIFFIKNYSSQVLKANMKIVGATEYAVVLYRDKLPKFNNGRQYDENGKIIRGSGKMIFNWFEWQRDNRKDYPKIHPTQKPINVLKRLIEIFTDEGDTVIDPCAGSGSTLQASFELGRNSYGFETNTKFYNEAKKKMPCFIK